MSNHTARKTLEQGRAEFAYQCVNQVIKLQSFRFGSKPFDNAKIIFDWLKKKLEKNNDSRIYKDFFANPVMKIEEYRNELNKEDSNDQSADGELKRKIFNDFMRYRKDYKSYVKKIPMLIKNNGLGATFAFINAKAKDNNPYRLIYCQTSDWLRNCDQICIALSANEDLAKWIISRDSSEYRAITVEVLAFFNWLKRFADGLIEGEDEGNSDDE
jgi:CRISPR-associated protein Cmr5